MKSVFLTIVCFLLLVSCNHKYSSNPLILHAEELLNTHPDSSFKILSAIKQPELMKAVDYAAWRLNYTYALNKLHKLNLSDTLVNFSIQYYEKRNDKKHAGTAYYLAGCIYRLSNKNKEAIIAFKKADKLLESTNEYRIKGLVQFNMGYMSMSDELYNHSLKYFKKSLTNFKLVGDMKTAAYAYREISDMYYQINYPFDSVMAYSNKALELAEKAGDSLNYYSTLSRQGELLYKTNLGLSKEYILRSYRYQHSNLPYYASYLAYIYSHLNKLDSARYYISISLADSTNRVLSYQAAAFIEKDKGEYQKAYKMLEKAYVKRDSVYEKNIRSQLYRIDKQFDLSESENQKAELTIANQTQLIWIILLVAAIVIAFFVIMLLINWNKKEKIIQNSKMQTLEFEKQSEKNNNEQKKEIIQLNLKNKIGNTLNIHKLKKGFTTKEAFVQEITEQSILTKNDWKIYIKDVNHLVDNGITRLKEEHTDLSETDQMVIALICLKVDINDSCNLLGMIKKTMYTRRKTIKKRLNLDAETDLEKWITQNLLKEE
jgi:hypothetical protein